MFNYRGWEREGDESVFRSDPRFYFLTVLRISTGDGGSTVIWKIVSSN